MSVNFEFLRDKFPNLAELGGFAEAYLTSDPASALAKMRTMAEAMVSDIYEHYQLQRPYRARIVDLIECAAFLAIVPRSVIFKIDFIRQQGNKAVHTVGTQFSAPMMETSLKETFNIAVWFFMALTGSKQKPCADFVPLKAAGKAKAESGLRTQLKILQKQDKLLEETLAEVEAKRELGKAPLPLTEQTSAAIRQCTQDAADALSFDEATTRKLLIDMLLREAGWNVPSDGSSTREVGQEILVKNQPTESGIGYADYILWSEDQKPLAVIEVKKTASDPRGGQTQAKLYADGLDKQYGTRPIIYYTNGFEIYMWNDSVNEPPRRIYGFYSRQSLESYRFRLKERCSIRDKMPGSNIVDRPYQFEAVKRVCECFADNKRKALIVQATGTGKTRVAMGICDVMLSNHWASRVLFLCDRKELRKQANNAFKDFLDNYPRTYLTAKSANDHNNRIYLATYPAMMKCYRNFDPGFFDLIIADESHRSIYNRYGELFMYFDSRQIGLTATPVDFISRNTFKLFQCEETAPTANYSYEKAVADGFLNPFKAIKVTTKFLREGMRYREMDPVQREQADDQDDDSETINYDKEVIDKHVFSVDTDRIILRNLMDNGLKVADDSRLGKTIVFARNHKHAVILLDLFNEMFPQYGADFCRVIDNYSSRPEQDIDDFKDNSGNNNLTIAISVDMLDTGIDVPEVLNLVFAKPVKSFAKFWQMIGRGTRLCKNLLGPGKDKECFYIFDHWGNFEYFDLEHDEQAPVIRTSLQQKLFENRIALAQTALKKQQATALSATLALIHDDIAALPETSCAVRDKWREKRMLENLELLKKFEPITVERLKQEIAPLMQWRSIAGEEAACRFDNQVTRLQISLLSGDSYFDSEKASLLEDLSLLPANINAVKDKLPLIEQVQNTNFWKPPTLTIESLEQIRLDLRGLMKYKRPLPDLPHEPRRLDITDKDIQVEIHKVKFKSADMAGYRVRVNGIFEKIFAKSSALQKIKAGQAVSSDDISELARQVAFIDPDFDLNDLLEYYPNKAGRIDAAIRRIVGLDAAKVNEFFSSFIGQHGDLTAHQIRFLDLLKTQIANYGALQVEQLWDAPFTHINSLGIDGVFPDPTEIDEIVKIVNNINEFAPQI